MSVPRWRTCPRDLGRRPARGRQPRSHEVGDSLMDPSRPDRILEEWSAVADGARQPSTPPRRVTVRAVSAVLSLAGAGVVALVLLATAVWLGRPGSTGPGAVVPTGSPSATVVETPAPSDSPAATATPTPT